MVATNDEMNLWIKEIHQGMVGLSFKVEKTLFSDQSRFQQVDVVKTHGHGCMLLNDGLIMLSERDEFVYHEMIAHVPLFVHPSPRHVLVIGGGDGGTVREVLKHSEISRVVMVEIDDMVVRACRTYLPTLSAAMDDPRLELLVEDGVKYVARTKERFDIIIIDSTDPVGPAAPLIKKPFYEKVAGLLKPDGILISQAESPWYDHAIQHAMLMNQRPFFKKLHIYLFSTLTYPGGLWSFAYGSKNLCPIRNFEPTRVERSGILTRYYNPGMHRSAFMLPNFVAENLSSVIDPIVW
jgi:spermidine synthase